MKETLFIDVLPKPALRGYVRRFEIFHFLFDKDVLPPIKFYPPRPEHCITFYIRDAQKFSYLNSTAVHAYPECTLIGMHTVPLQRYGGRDFLAIKAVLQPWVLWRLIKIPLNELTNQFVDAEEIWGSGVRSVCGRLRELIDLDQMIAVIEAFLEDQVKKVKGDPHPIDRVAGYIMNTENRAPMDWLAGQSCLSIRQFIRKFAERNGTSAKKFERIVRFDRAYRMRNANSGHDWLSIAMACKYNDYQHMVKDFKAFTDLTPNLLYELEQESEHSFGISYKI